jgi:transcriptional regulator with XRE-family HTH domain
VENKGKTAVIMRNIVTAKSVTTMLKATNNESGLPTLGEHLDRLRLEKGIKKEEFFALGGISTAYGYEILRNLKSPSRDILIQFAFILELGIDETQELLKIGTQASLYPRLKRDALIIYGLANGMNIADVNIAAKEHGILPIGNY